MDRDETEDLSEFAEGLGMRSALGSPDVEDWTGSPDMEDWRTRDVGRNEGGAPEVTETLAATWIGMIPHHVEENGTPCVGCWLDHGKLLAGDVEDSLTDWRRTKS